MQKGGEIAAHFAHGHQILEIQSANHAQPKRRVWEFLVIGLLDGKHWSAVITYRGANVRLISMRRARTEEVVLYES